MFRTLKMCQIKTLYYFMKKSIIVNKIVNKNIKYVIYLVKYNIYLLFYIC
jgi:hypothetical protein